ncbi:TRSP domain-containing protein, partial [Clostridium sp.]
LKGDVYFKSTTRSPIYCSDEKDYLIREKSTFYHNEVKYYFYNRTSIEENYDKVILITEDDLDIKLTNQLLIFKP